MANLSFHTGRNWAKTGEVAGPGVQNWGWGWNPKPELLTPSARFSYAAPSIRGARVPCWLEGVSAVPSSSVYPLSLPTLQPTGHGTHSFRPRSAVQGTFTQAKTHRWLATLKPLGLGHRSRWMVSAEGHFQNPTNRPHPNAASHQGQWTTRPSQVFPTRCRMRCWSKI